MNGKQTSHREHQSVRLTFSRKLFSFRSLILMSLMALCLISLESTALVRIGYIDRCQQELAECLKQVQGNSASEASCQDRYDDCVEDGLK